MSDDLVNQLTLNFLISKHQLLKLNKRLKETTEQTRKTDKEIYGERIKHLFNDLLVNETPQDVLQDVKTGFEFFVDKCIYYFKALDNNDTSEKDSVDESSMIQDDIDYEKEGNSIERGNYKENDLEEDRGVRGFPVKEEDSEEEEEDGGVRGLGAQNPVKELNGGIRGLPVVKHKLYKKNTSVGVDDIQKLPLDWFQNVKENYKKNQIIPRKKYITFEEQPFRDPKKKI